MKLAGGSSFAATILAAAVVAMTAPADAAEARKIHFDCDTTPGHSSTMDLPLATGQRKVAGSVKAIQLYQIERWLPSAQIRLSEQDGSRWIALALIAARPYEKVISKDAAVTLAIRKNAGDGSTIQQETVGTLPLGEGLPLELSTSADRTIINIAGEAHIVDFRLAGPRRLALVCSTGEFEFSDILVD